MTAMTFAVCCREHAQQVSHLLQSSLKDQRTGTLMGKSLVALRGDLAKYQNNDFD